MCFEGFRRAEFLEETDAKRCIVRSLLQKSEFYKRVRHLRDLQRRQQPTCLTHDSWWNTTSVRGACISLQRAALNSNQSVMLWRDF